MIKAGVVLVTQFAQPGSKGFNGYINYINRTEAVRNEYTSEYNLYQDYMGNPMKTTALFSKKIDSLSESQKNTYQEVFKKAQEDGSLMWQTVVSFDNRWLEKNGLYDSKKNILDEKKIKEIIRGSMNTLLEKENLQNAVWTAAVHYNTDNIHIHIATVDPLLERKTKMVDGKETYIGRMKMKNLEAAKSYIVNEIVLQRDMNLYVNKIIRENIIRSKKQCMLSNDQDMSENFLAIHSSLPEDRRLWKYNNNAMKFIRPEIDELSRQFIEKYHMEDYRELSKILNKTDRLYKEAYGGETGNDYKVHKLKDLYSRLGNAVLDEIKEYDRKYEWPASEYQFEWKDHREIEILDEIEELSLETSEEYKEDESEKIFYADDYKMEWSAEYKQIKKDLYNTDSNKEKVGKDLDRLVQQGNILAMYDRGMMVDPDKADYYFENALTGFRIIKTNNPENRFIQNYTAYRIGMMLKKGQGSDPDLKEAFEFLKESADLGNQYAQYNVGNLCFDGRNDFADKSLGMKYFEKSAKQGNPYAAFRLGYIYQSGSGVEKDDHISLEYYTKAFNKFCEQECYKRNPVIEYKIGYMLYQGLGTDKDYSKAVEYLERAKQAGNKKAEFLIADINLQSGDKEKRKIGEEYFRKAADAGNEKAAYKIGRFYMRQNDPKAIHYMKLSADQGNQYAQYALGKLYLQEGAPHQDIPAAVTYMKLSADQGNQYAQYALGKLYLQEGAPHQDIPAAVTYMKLSADQGNQYAQYALGKLYLQEGAPHQDIPAAVTYMKLSADQGNQYAQYALGKLYWYGTGVPIDKENAKRLFQDAADQGNPYAQKFIDQVIEKNNIKQYPMGRSAMIDLDMSLRKLKKTMDNTVNSFKNQVQYEQMMWEIDKEKNRGWMED